MKHNSGDIWLTAYPGKHTFSIVTIKDVNTTRAALNGGWKVYFYDGNGIWWEDNNLLEDDNFWDMIGKLKSGKWILV
jgi:hypothetical protein